MHALRAEGMKVVAMETTERSANYVRFAFPPAGVALVLGNEEVGVDVDVLAECDAIVELPTFGTKNSLNIASAASIVLYEILRQWGVLDSGRRPSTDM